MDALEQLLRIMDALRDPVSGCPWDLEQDFRSIAPHTLEEVHEVIDAIERDAGDELVAELGDLLFQIVFYARLGKEQGHFTFEDIASGIVAKLLRRHPHVFPDGTLASAGSRPGVSSGEVAGRWEVIKQEERAGKQSGAPVSLLDDVPLALGALQRAAKLQKRAAVAGFDWPGASDVLVKLDEELGELREAMAEGDHNAVQEEFGDLLFTLVNLSRHLGLDAETALRAANRKFETRFRKLEQGAAEQGSVVADLDLGALEALWQAVKAGEKPLA